MKKIGVWFAALGALVAVWSLGAGAAGNVIYVTQDGAGNQNGSSWSNAYASADLRAAILSADAGKEVWVAEGTYTPTIVSTPSWTDRNVSFVLKSGVAIYGGFRGNEAARDLRDPKSRVTTLSGNVGDPATSGDNSIHVVKSENVDATAVLDGFTIRHGNANGTANTGYSWGGGLYNLDAGPTIRNCDFRDNHAVDSGGGVFTLRGNPTIENCDFRDNHAARSGGAILTYINGGDPTGPTIRSCDFTGNSANEDGGAVFNSSCNPTIASCAFRGNRSAGSGGAIADRYAVSQITDCAFEDNVAGGDGGAIRHQFRGLTVERCVFRGNSGMQGGGALHSVGEDFNPVTSTITDCTFEGNAAVGAGGGALFNGVFSTGNVQGCTFRANRTNQQGGAIQSDQGSMKVRNSTFASNGANRGGSMSFKTGTGHEVFHCTLTGNTASADRAGITLEGGAPLTVRNTILWNGGGEISPDIATVNFCVVQGGYKLASDPANHITSADPILGPLADNGGNTQTCALATGSSAVDAGTMMPEITADQRGVVRPLGSGYDMGAYEYDPAHPPTPTLTPIPSATPTPEATPTPTAAPTPEATPTPETTPIPTGGPVPSGGPTPVTPSGMPPSPIPGPDPRIPLPSVTLRDHTGGIGIRSADILEPGAPRLAFASDALSAQLISADPDAVANGRYNIGLVRFFATASALAPGAVGQEFTARFLVEDAPAGMTTRIFVLLRTFDDSGNPTGTFVVPWASEKDSGQTENVVTSRFTVPDGGVTDWDRKVDGQICAQVACVVAVFRTAEPPISGAVTPTVSPSQAPTSSLPGGGGGGCNAGLAWSLALPLLLAAGIRRR